MRTICADNNVPCLVERSRSGKGTHVWIFFEKAIIIKKVKEILRYTKQRNANKSVYLEFMNSKKKAKFRAEHEPEIILYEAAIRELKKLLKGNPVPAEKKTITKIRELSARKNEEYEELSEIKKRERSFQEKVINVRSIFEDNTKQNRTKRIEQEL